MRGSELYHAQEAFVACIMFSTLLWRKVAGTGGLAGIEEVTRNDTFDCIVKGLSVGAAWTNVDRQNTTCASLVVRRS